MKWFGSRKSKVLAFLVTLVIALVAVYAVGSITSKTTSSPTGSASSGNGAEETNGPAAFVGHATNGVMFIQWTRSGDSVTGSLQEAITKRPSGSGLSSNEAAFTGVIHGNGVTLNTTGAESKAFVGELKGDGFALTVPGQNSRLITINFEPGEVASYNAATKELLDSEYSSPCSLFVASNDVRVSITGPNAPEECANFVQKATNAEWTTIPQEGAAETTVICEVTNRANEKALVTDEGGAFYGKQACTQLSGEGWG
jgi:hypothetical protein